MFSRVKSLLTAALTVALLGVAYPVVAQQIRTQPQTATLTLSAWTSATSLNATQTIFTPGDSGFEAVAVQLTQTTTLSAGAVTFEVSFDNTNWITVPADAVHDPTSATWATIALPYTVQASTNKIFLLHTKGWQALRVKLSTQITGSGSVTPNVTFLPVMPVADVIALSPTAGNFLTTTTLGAGSALAGEVAPMASATTTDALSNCYLSSAASTNATNCKASAGNVYRIHVQNTNTTNYFLRLYNASGTPTCSSATGYIESILIPRQDYGGVNGWSAAVPLGFSTGIAFCVTGGSSSTDNTNAATGILIAIDYK